ncbi:hypothetical protein HUW51_15695 [Adhaeribacter swui]|uniref:Uncharacterized protein n=1 Tax=Adhaeribacter swui TaxID=2086471 RepID=A0A7G7GAB0_9BACT|nr:sigma factor [Adhaeribacter swui]QNF34094.1 hypothetical protein HUW51_15695 [Adhaeribacter swui]
MFKDFVKEDAVLWEEFKGGNYNSFTVIYQNYIQVLYSYGLQVIKDPELVEDCIQDLFIYIWDNKNTLGKTENIKFYLFKALRRRIVVKLKLKDREELNDDFTHHTSHVQMSYEQTLMALNFGLLW